MRTRILLPVTALLLSLALSANAENKQIITIGGQQVAKTAERLTFEGDQVVLHYSDQTTETADMQDVVIVFTVANALKVLESAEKDAPLSYYDLQGRLLKKAPRRGAYIIKKGEKIVKVMKQN